MQHLEKIDTHSNRLLKCNQFMLMMKWAYSRSSCHYKHSLYGMNAITINIIM